jgi:hypothetical protein
VPAAIGNTKALGGTWPGARAEEAWPAIPARRPDHLGDAGGRQRGGLGRWRGEDRVDVRATVGDTKALDTGRVDAEAGEEPGDGRGDVKGDVAPLGEEMRRR